MLNFKWLNKVLCFYEDYYLTTSDVFYALIVWQGLGLDSRMKVKKADFMIVHQAIIGNEVKCFLQSHQKLIIVDKKL